MSAPRHVPMSPNNYVDSYRSPEVVPPSWKAERPGDLSSGQPSGGLMGHQGPDQGFALRLCKTFRDRIYLADGEHREDVEKGCVQIALKRASLFGRAPVVHDLEIAFRIWGFLDLEPDQQLVAERLKRFEGVSEGHHYSDVRRLAATVPNESLAMSPKALEDQHSLDWASLLEFE